MARSRKTKSGKPARRDCSAILDDLAAHGFNPRNYIKIKMLVSVAFPQARVRFVERFGRCTIQSVLDQINGWKEFLNKQSLLTTDDIRKVEQLVLNEELLVWQALLEMNLPQIGPWNVSSVLVPSGIDTRGRSEYLPPGLRLTAVHTTTKEQREVSIRAKEYGNPSRWPGSWRTAFEELGIWDLVDRGTVHKGLMSLRRESKGWPAFTQDIVPKLYECLAPFYKKPGHHFTTQDAREDRPAMLPKELLEIMLDILAYEHPNHFAAARIDQLKAVIWRYQESCRSARPS